MSPCRKKFPVFFDGSPLVEVNCSKLNQETAMGKKAQKRPFIPEKGHASWVRSFISIFEFSQSNNLRKLLADRKCRSARYPGTSFLNNSLSKDAWDGKYEHDANAYGCEDTVVLSRFPSIKALIEEEMSREKSSKASDCNIKSNKKMTKNRKSDSDPRINNLIDSVYIVLEKFKCREQVEGSNLIFDLAALMIEFYSVSRKCSNMCEEIEVDLCGPLRSSGHKKHKNLDRSDSQPSYRHSMLQEALVVEAEAFLSQKIDDTKRLVGNGVIHAQEFMDALEILNSNKELFLKLVQDPNSLVFSHIQELLKPQVADFSKLQAVHRLEGSGHSEKELRDSDQNGESISNQIVQKQHFLSKKDKFWGETLSKIRNTSKDTSKIVVLQPQLSRNRDDSTQNSPCLSSQSRHSKKFAKDCERTLSHFSFKEIKRKLRFFIDNSRKEQHLISKDSFSSIPNGYKGSANTYSVTSSTESLRTNITSQTDCSTENFYQSVASNSEAEKNSMAKEWLQKLKAETAQCKLQGSSPASTFRAESFEGEVAQKHFSEMTSTEYKTANSTNNQISNSLEKMISPSDCNLLKLHLIDDTSVILSTEESLKGTPFLSSDLDAEVPVINTEAAIDKISLQEETCNEDQPDTEGRGEILEIENTKYVHINRTKEFNTLGTPDGCSSCESCKNGCSTPSEPDTPNEKPRILIPSASVSPNHLIINHFQSSEFIMEKPERPSPVSVLEPFFLEDEASPDSPSVKLDELHRPLQPIHLSFHEDSAVVITSSDCLIPHQRICSYDIEIITKYIRNVLETYTFDSEMSPERWPSSELLLQPSVSDEIKSWQSSFPEDPKLLLDCVNEVLSDMKDRRFQVFPWLSFLKPTVHPILKDFIINDVCKTVKSYLSSQTQSTINELMRKDMDSAMWMVYRLEMECIIAEMSCNIFEELMEETIFELFFLL